MVNYSHFIEEAMVLMWKPSVIDSPSGRSPEKAPRWYLTGTAGCGGGQVVSWLSLIDLGYKSIYRRKKYVVELRGAHKGGGVPTAWARPLASWPPRGVPDFDSKSSRLLSVQERSSQRFHSVWTPFGMPSLQNSKIGKKTETGTGPPVNRLVPKII